MSARSEAPSDEGNLGESAYEFIDTDEESRDDNATESVASTDFDRPDDVASLADTEHSGDESGEEDGLETSALRGIETNVDQAFNTPTLGRSSAVLVEDMDKPLAQSIEFEEPYSLAAEVISVKHTVAEFNDEQTASTVQSIALQNPPKRLAVTIRQTMTKQGLSTRDPLRILYVGSHSAKQDIIHKIASSVTASVESRQREQHLRHFPQLYNVVPVSAFGSERTPEIELMHSSGYQINVEDCTFAQTLKFEDVPEKPDVIKLTLDDNFSYHSVPEGRGFIVEPYWELPHVAIFYCSDNDDLDARRTTTIARKFMSRHSVPSIVISHKQLFDKGQCMSLDQHSIHMCLESRDPNGRGSIIHRRLPVDLASFLNIDARQMNRNLAYITGLHEHVETLAPSSITKKTDVNLTNPPDVEKTSYSISDSVSFIRNRNGAEWRALLPVGLLLLSVFAAVLTGIPSYRFSSAPAISINSKTMSAVPISTSSTSSATPIPSLISTSASIAVKASTRTVTVTHAPSQGPNSLSIVPSMELGKLAHNPQASAKPANKSSVCTAEILGDREILIRIPSATKLSWLTKEALSVNITRSNMTVDTERAYSSDEGIVLSLPKRKAYGILNISIITTKKPRVNETFQVNFGTSPSHTWQNLKDKLTSIFGNEGNLVDPQTYEQVRKNAEKLAEDARIQSQSTLLQMEEATKMAMKHAASTSSRLTEIAKSLSLEAAKRSAIFSKELGIQLSEAGEMVSKTLPSLDQICEPLESGLLRAQVQSKLLWLKIRGNDAEHRAYKQRAAQATGSKTEDLKKSRKQLKKSLKKNRVGRKVGKGTRG
ncbi:hypothetical protein D0Z07_4795 [Hyphodiscus hymeniophilus]|uniref:Uncharacterized protein n=1 Tax=Hyphodiscus hymeniophilus TaxID=353542 RepID=A0A9P6VJQ5_9HELO|nr:hypothetical protein D0Z07_4795 [Hyphodiscus hymeniophilus]